MASAGEVNSSKGILGKMWQRTSLRVRIGFFAVIVCAAVLIILALGMKNALETDGKTTKLGFEDIGVLETQVTHTTQVKVMEASRELFGHQIPFTQSKYIYSYDVDVQAGLDFSQIEWSVDGKKITVKLPEVKVTDCKADPQSFKVYHEQESIFRQVSLEENNAALQEMERLAQEDAVANGLLERARENAKTLLTGFFSTQFDLRNEYEIEFVDQ